MLVTERLMEVIETEIDSIEVDVVDSLTASVSYMPRGRVPGFLSIFVLSQ